MQKDQDGMNLMNVPPLVVEIRAASVLPGDVPSGAQPQITALQTKLAQLNTTFSTFLEVEQQLRPRLTQRMSKSETVLWYGKRMQASTAFLALWDELLEWGHICYDEKQCEHVLQIERSRLEVPPV